MTNRHSRKFVRNIADKTDRPTARRNFYSSSLPTNVLHYSPPTNAKTRRLPKWQRRPAKPFYTRPTDTQVGKIRLG